MKRRVRTLVLSVVLVVGLAIPGASGAGTYDDPFFLNWPEFVPAVPGDFVASTEQACERGSNKCVDKVIKEMTRRYNRLGCDHDGAFAFTYLLTTQEYRAAVEDPNFFEDNAFVNHQDAVFADLYFDQFDAWHAGDLDGVSPAWRIAFHAAENEEVTGIGDVFLGMSAHVNRDLPFVLHAIGLVQPDGSTRKADHDRVNDFLNAVNQYLLNEAAKYHDPTMDDGDIPGTSWDNSQAVQALTTWREGAWRNAERLANAPDDAARALIAQEIENEAALIGLGIRESLRYNVTHTLAGTDNAARDAFCATNWVSRSWK